MSVINLKDSFPITDSGDHNKTIMERMSGGPKRTRIVITNHDTGEVLGEIQNKILVPGSQMTAWKQFGARDKDGHEIDGSLKFSQLIQFPTYNNELNLENSLPDYSGFNTNEYYQPYCCLWCVGRDGAGSSANEVFIVTNTDRISPNPAEDGILPFRYVNKEMDLDDDQREVYFGRFVNTENNMVSYYFKKFDTTPQLHVQFLDGTQVVRNMWDIVTSQAVEIYVEMRLSVSRLDFRDYFDQVLGWDNANISSVSLVTAWHIDREQLDPPRAGKYYKYYQDIIPFSKFNFKPEDLTDLTRAIDFNYQVFY